MPDDENKGNKNPANLLTSYIRESNVLPMARNTAQINFRLRDNDKDILKALRLKLGVDHSQVFRLSIRKLAETNGIDVLKRSKKAS